MYGASTVRVRVVRVPVWLCVFLKYVATGALNYVKAPCPIRVTEVDGHGARFAGAFLAWSWLHVLQQIVQNDGFQRTSSLQLHREGRRGDMRTGVLLSPSGHRAEHEVARSWTERSRPRGHRPRGREHERARFLTSRDVWAPTRELAFGRYSLTPWLDTGTRSYAVGIGLGLTGSTSCRDQVEQRETRSDPDWRPQCRKRRITRDAQTRFCGEFGESDKGANTT